MKWVFIGIGTAIFVGFLVWLFMASTKPSPGIEMIQDGRTHLNEGSKVDYKFNPPTSGDHYASWITKGFYEEPRPDGNIVHSMEHGYIIIWYDCGRKEISNKRQDISKLIAYPLSLITPVSAQTQPMTQGSEGSPSAKLTDMPKSFSDGSCNDLKNHLKSILKEFGPHKLIVMPRVGMDSKIILTAWGRMEKLSSVDEGKIKEFINTYRDNGPEHTNEP